jgi:sarcosine oxidase subunit delta
MLEIRCPYCGKRSQNEFAYGGDATIKRPKLNKEISDQEWDNFIYYRKNPRGEHLELWHHISGCRQWFKAKRNTATHEIIETYELNQDSRNSS